MATSEEAIYRLQDDLLRAIQEANIPAMVNALRDMATIRQARGESDVALNTLDECLRLQRDLGDRAGEAQTLNNTGVLLQEKGELAQAVSRFEASLALWRALEDEDNEAVTAFNLAGALFEQGDLHGAEARLARAVEIHERSNHPQLYNELAALEQVREALEES